MTNSVSRNNLKSITFMLISSFSTALLLSLVKTLSKDISSNQAVFFYKSLVLLMILPWVFKNGIATIRTKKIGLYIIGAIFSTTASLCLMYSLKHVPLADATCLGYLEKVSLAAIGMIFFKEKCSIVKIMAILCSFIGAVIVVNPAVLHGSIPFAGGFDWRYMPVFLSIALWVSYCLVFKLIGRTESNKTQIFYNTLFSVIISLSTVIIDWQPVVFMGIQVMQPHGFEPLTYIKASGKDYVLIQIMALCYLMRSIASFKALQFSDLSVVIPFGYAKVFFSGVLGAMLFSQYPVTEAYIGYSIILISVYCLFRAELRNQRKS